MTRPNLLVRLHYEELLPVNHTHTKKTHTKKTNNNSMHYKLVATLSGPMEGRLNMFEPQIVIHITTFVKLCWYVCYIITSAVAIPIMDEVHIPQ